MSHPHVSLLPYVFAATSYCYHCFYVIIPRKFSIAPEKLPSQKVVFQPPFLRGYAKLRGCIFSHCTGSGGVHAKAPLTKHIGLSQSQERLIKKSHRFLLLKRRFFCGDGEGG